MADTKLSALTELAATPASNDEVYIRDVSEAAADESKRITVANLLAASSLSPQWIPVTIGTSLTGSTVPGQIIAASSAFGTAVLLVPGSFTTLTSLEAILLAQATGANMHITIQTYFANYAGGEDFTTGSGAGANVDIGATVTQQYLAWNISGYVAGLAAGDILSVKLTYSATEVASNLVYVGLRFLWT